MSILWAASLNDLKKDIDELGFVSWKADFDYLANRGDYEARIANYRTILKHAWMKTQFTLCPEYDAPRYGWYFAKEYGSIYFQNIQEAEPPHLTFVPYHVLRQHWFMAKYFPSNKLQVLLQNPKRTRKDFSDASRHGHGYCFAMGIPFVPCFFQLAQYLDDDGKKELKPLLLSTRTRRTGCGTLSNCQMLTAKPQRSQRDAEQDNHFLDNPFHFAPLCALCDSAVNLQVSREAT